MTGWACASGHNEAEVRAWSGQAGARNSLFKFMIETKIGTLSLGKNQAFSHPLPRRLAVMTGIGTDERGNFPCELWLNESGRLTIVAYSEGRYASTHVDLFDLMEWLQTGPGNRLVLDHGPNASGTRSDFPRD